MKSKMFCEICNSNEDDCYCYKCSSCGSKDLVYFDDGAGYPPNILCEACGHWD